MGKLRRVCTIFENEVPVLLVLLLTLNFVIVVVVPWDFCKQGFDSTRSFL